MPFSGINQQLMRLIEAKQRARARQEQEEIAYKRAQLGITQDAMKDEQRLNRDKFEAERSDKIRAEGKEAVSSLDRNMDIQNLKSGHMSEAEYALKWGGAGGKSALGGGGAKTSDLRSLERDLRADYDAAQTQALTTGKPLVDDTGAPLSFEAYANAKRPEYAARYGMTGGLGLGQQMRAAGKDEDKRYAVEGLNLQNNLVTSSVDAAGRPVDAGAPGSVKKFTMGGSGAQPIAVPPDASILQRGTPLAPVSATAGPPAPAPTVAPTVVPKTPETPAAASAAAPTPQSLWDASARVGNALTKFGKRQYQHTARPLAQALNKTLLGTDDPVRDVSNWFGRKSYTNAAYNRLLEDNPPPTVQLQPQPRPTPGQSGRDWFAEEIRRKRGQ